MTPRADRVSTPDQEMRIPVMIRPWRRLIETHRLGIPLRSPEQIDAIDEDCRFVPAHIEPLERLPNAVGFGIRVAIHDGNFEAISMPLRRQSLTQIGQAHHDCAPRAAGAEHQNPQRSTVEKTGQEKTLDAQRPLPRLNEFG